MPFPAAAASPVSARRARNGSRVCFPAWQGRYARAAASSPRAAVQAGSSRRATAGLPAAPVGFRTAAARPL